MPKLPQRRVPGSLERGPVERRRGKSRRKNHGRRRSDIWMELGKLFGLVASVTGAILGQAELVGEPYRHWLTVTCIATTGGFGYLLGPRSASALLEQLRKIVK